MTAKTSEQLSKTSQDFITFLSAIESYYLPTYPWPTGGQAPKQPADDGDDGSMLCGQKEIMTLK